MSCTRPGYTCSFVCRMYRLQHEEGWYFLHEHLESELPWREDCVNEVQEKTGAKLVSVNQGSCKLSSVRSEGNVGLDEKPPTMMTSCQAIAFTLSRRYTKHLDSSEHRLSEHKNIEDLHETIFRGMQLQHKRSKHHKYLFGHCGREESPLEFQRLGEQCFSGRVT